MKMTWCGILGVRSITESSRNAQMTIRRVWGTMNEHWSEFDPFPMFLLALTGRGSNFSPNACETLFIIRSFFSCCFLLMCWLDTAIGEWGPYVLSLFSSYISFLRDAFSQSNPNFNKIQINTNWDRYERPLSNAQGFQSNLPSAIILFKKIGNKMARSNMWPPHRVITIRSFKCSPYQWMNTTDVQSITKKKWQSDTHAYAMQYKKVNLVACQVWSKVKLFHMLFKGYLNHVRQSLSALLKNKHVLYYNAMQGTTQAHFLVKLLKSRTLSSFRNRQKSPHLMV